MEQVIYLVTMYDRVTKEPTPVGIFDDKEKIKRMFDGYKYDVLEYTMNNPDYETINGLA